MKGRTTARNNLRRMTDAELAQEIIKCAAIIDEARAIIMCAGVKTAVLANEQSRRVLKRKGQ